MQLENDHNVYILGAGFSRDAGLPLLPDFLIRMRDSHPWLQSQGRQKEADAVADVLKFRLDMASAAYWTSLDLESIEELFSLASAGPTGLGKQVQLAIAATLEFVEVSSNRGQGRYHIENLPCVNHLAWLTPDQPNGQDFHGNRYAHHVGKLIGLFDTGTPKGRNTFITFNYDTLLEDALSVLGVPFGYGFRKKSVKYEATCKASKAATDLEVLKLHGSVNWAIQGSSRRWAFRVFGNYSDVRGASLIPELLPPTWKKVFTEHLAAIWKSAIEQLSTATRVIIIGFSLPPTDLHFRYLLAAGLQKNVSVREILFVDPRAADVKVRAASLFRQQYLESNKIRFEACNLESFAGENSALERIGRPVCAGARIQFS